LVGKLEGKRPLGGPRRRCEINIRMNLREVGCRGVDWFHLARDRDQWQIVFEYGNDPSDSIKDGGFLTR
jgi:hypothetical protein